MKRNKNEQALGSLNPHTVAADFLGLCHLRAGSRYEWACMEIPLATVSCCWGRMPLVPGDGSVLFDLLP